MNLESSGFTYLLYLSVYELLFFVFCFLFFLRTSGFYEGVRFEVVRWVAFISGEEGGRAD